jgi:hypothetical protein
VDVLELEVLAGVIINVLDLEGVVGVSTDALKDEFGGGIIACVLVVVASSVVEWGAIVPQIVISLT